MEKITFACESCGQQMAVREEHAGRRVRCTSCQDVLVVPDRSRGGRVADDPPRDGYREKRKSESRRERGDSRPSDFDFDEPPRRERGERRRARSREEDDDYRDEDDFDDREEERRPRKRRGARPSRSKKGGIAGGGAGLIALIALVLVVLAGGGVGIYYLFSGGIDEDVDLVPNDAAFFVSISPKDLKDASLFKKMKDELKAGDQIEKGLTPLTKAFDLDVDDVERVTVFRHGGEDTAGSKETVIVKTAKTFKKEDVLERFEKEHGNGEQSSKDKHEGKEYFVAGTMAIYLHSTKIFVFGPEEGVKQSIAAGQGKGPKKGVLQEAKELASSSSYQLAMGANAKYESMARQGMRKFGGDFSRGFGMPGMGKLDKKKLVGTFTAVGVDSGLDTVVGYVFEDAADAKSTAKDWQEEIDDIIKKAKKEKDKAPSAKIANLVIDMLEDIDIDYSGKTMTLKLSMGSSFFDTMIEERKNKGRPGGFGF